MSQGVTFFVFAFHDPRPTVFAFNDPRPTDASSIRQGPPHPLRARRAALEPTPAWQVGGWGWGCVCVSRFNCEAPNEGWRCGCQVHIRQTHQASMQRHGQIGLSLAVCVRMWVLNIILENVHIIHSIGFFRLLAPPQPGRGLLLRHLLAVQLRNLLRRARWELVGRQPRRSRGRSHIRQTITR
jgi:hypothetical protein